MDLQGSTTTEQGAQSPQNSAQSGLQTQAQGNVQNSVVTQSSLLLPSSSLHVETCAQNCALGVSTTTPVSNTHITLPILGIGVMLALVAVVGLFVAKVMKS